jgi:hypothetical protein
VVGMANRVGEWQTGMGMGGGLLYPQPLPNPKILGVWEGKEGWERGLGKKDEKEG